MIRALVGNDQDITRTFYAADEETAAEPAAAPVVTVEREDGTDLTGGTASLATSVATFPLTAAAHLTRVDELKVVWTASVNSKAQVHTDYVKVVGARFFGIPSLRALKGLSSTSTFTNAELKAARDLAEEFVEQFTEEAWVPQYRRETHDGTDEQVLYLHRINVRELLSVTLDGSAQDTSGWTVSGSGRILTDGAVFTCSAVAKQNVVVQYAYGYSEPPQDLANATRKLARHLLLAGETGIPDRARMMQTEWGMFQLDIADEKKPTGIPEIDSVLCRYRAARPDWVVS